MYCRVVVAVVACSAVVVVVAEVVVAVVAINCTCSCLSSYLAIYLSICKFENEAILRDFLNFWNWQHQKRSNSARLSQLLNLITSKRKQFCETSSIFQVDNIKNETILRRLPSKMESWIQSWRPRTIASWAPGPPNISDEHVSCTAPATENAFLQILFNSNVPRLPTPLKLLQNPHVCSLLTRCTIPCACRGKRHLNVQKWSEHVVFLTFWLGNVLRATTACTSQLPKVLRGWGVLCILTSTCASRHKTRFDISISKLLRTWGAFTLPNVLRATTACNFLSLIQMALHAPL